MIEELRQAVKDYMASDEVTPHGLVLCKGILSLLRYVDG